MIWFNFQGEKTNPEPGEIREGVILIGFYNLRLKFEPNHNLGL
jgi:hypothetical protein